MRARWRVMSPVVLVLALVAVTLLGRSARGQCQLQCNITAENYKIGLTCEKGAASERYSDQTNYEYTSAGDVGALVLKINRERTYSASNRTYHIAGTIRVDKTAGTTSYDIQATGGLLGVKAANCKTGNAVMSSPPPAAQGIRVSAGPPSPPREQTLNFRVAGDYQPAIVVPLCAAALKKNQTAIFACFVSEPGEYIGQGKTWLLPAQNPSASAEVFFERVQLHIPDAEGKWDFRFSTPRGVPWRAGLFDNAMRDGFHDAAHPGLDISGHSSGCSDNTGRFEVLELVSDVQGRTIQKFAANFEQICSGRRLRGLVRFNSTVD